MVVKNSDNSSVMLAQNCLRDRLTHRVVPPLFQCVDSEYSQLHGLIQRSATASESNSLLLIGPRGCGKTMLLKKVLDDLKTDDHVRNNLLEVHLNGLMQTNDRIALTEITRQLQLENTVGEKVFGSFAENLQFLLDSLKSGGQKSKSILFVLEEFDLFAHHKNQTLLYNLFDVSQSAQTPICVLGITVRLDVIELLEKRVKSRFSHRQLLMLPRFSFEQYCEIFTNYLSLPDDFSDKKYSKVWNAHVKKVSEDNEIIALLKRQYQTCKNIRDILTIMMLPVCKISANQPYLLIDDFKESFKLFRTDAKAATLKGISVLELCLIIAMKHLMEIYDGEAFNFEMIYREYQKFCQSKASLQNYEKAVVLKAFEHLCSLELVNQVDSGARIQKEYRLHLSIIEPTQIKDALESYAMCPTEVKQWSQTAVITN